VDKAERGRCLTCRWWEGEDPRAEGWPQGRWRLCNAAGYDHPDPDDRFVCKDAEEYAAWLVTHETFGCVMWEAER
jgi:hypothetical protein